MQVQVGDWERRCLCSRRAWSTTFNNRGRAGPSPSAGQLPALTQQIHRGPSGQPMESSRSWQMIFNISLRQAIVSRCLRTSVIVPVAKKPVTSRLKHPVALTITEIKCLEWLVTPHVIPTAKQKVRSPSAGTQSYPIWTIKTPTLESCTQFQHLIIPQRRIEKPRLRGLNSTTRLWILDLFDWETSVCPCWTDHVGLQTSHFEH